MSEPTGKIYEIRTLHDLLQLDERQIDDALISIKKWWEVRTSMVMLAQLTGVSGLTDAVQGFCTFCDDGNNDVSNFTITMPDGQETNVTFERKI